MNFKKTTLDKFITLQRGYDLPAQDRIPGSIPIIAANGPVGFHNVPKVNTKCVVLGRSGSVGNPQLISQPFWPLNTTLFVKNFHGNSPTFVYYVLKTIDFKSFDAGGTVPTLNRNHLTQIEVPLVDFTMQESIGKFLENLDSKIESNKTLSKTLEDIAQSVFKSWFIDFDPVKAKMAGEKPVGMNASTSAALPDSMEESELGMIPKGWAVKGLGDLITPKKGKTITKATCVDGQVPVVAGGLQPAYFHNKANVKQPAITISASGANAGFVRLYLKDIWASDCSFINSEITQTIFFWYLYLSRNQEIIYGMQQGAAQPHIYPSDLMRLKLIYPNSIDLVMKFQETVAPLFLEIGALERQNESLRNLRDSLLPRLISGEVQIPDEALAL
jgi:type I restriction enzyme S subunit